MFQFFQQSLCRLRAMALIGLIVFMFAMMASPHAPAIAAIRGFEEKPGQTVYQARDTLKDQAGRTWQAIVFKRIKSDGTTVFNLRLVGFPGSVRIDRSQPLQLSNSLGDSLNAPDASSQMFSDVDAPEPHIAQYDLQPILAKLRWELPWRLTLQTESGEMIALSVPPAFLMDWQTLSQPDGTEVNVRGN